MSTRECYAGVAESSIYVADCHRGKGIGKALIRPQVIAADTAGLWTLQTAIFTENRQHRPAPPGRLPHHRHS